MSNEDILQRLRNILAKTVANGATEEEEHSAILMAQRLAAKYGINLDELNEEEVKIDEVLLEFDSKSVSVIQKKIAVEFQEHFGVKCILKRSSKGTFLFTVGEAYKAKIFKEAIQYVYNSFKFHWSRYHKTLDCSTAEKNLMRGAYLTGFISGYTQKLVEQEQKYSLVVVTSPELNDYMKAKIHGHSRFSLRFSDDVVAYAHGYRDGDTSYQKHSQLQ